MKSTSRAALALVAWYTRDPMCVERLFQHLTPSALENLHEGIQPRKGPRRDDDDGPSTKSDCEYRVLAKAAIRRMVHKQLDTCSSIAPPDQVEAALKYYTLPTDLQLELWNKYGGSCAPTTWWEALGRLREISGSDSTKLWRLVLDHPMTAYVPMHCQNCGHIIPDIASDVEDCDIGLSEVDPLVGEDVLELRGGWFRGRPRPAKILQLDCPSCGSVTRWYRSGHPQTILNPNKWGRLCGEQEHIRLALANYLEISLRVCIPIDWDHIWSEFASKRDLLPSTPGPLDWLVHDDSARNFAVRLDEGIGIWTGVLGIHENPSFCEDLTSQYLCCRPVADEQAESNVPLVGRADPCHSQEMLRYSKLVETARKDQSGNKTQSKTVVGYLLLLAGMTSDQITNDLQRASIEYGTKGWWETE